MDIIEKTRRLKKYEASDAVAFRSEDSPGMDFLSPFGPMIGRTRISVDLIDHLNAVSDAILTPGQGAEFELSEPNCSWGGEDSLQSCVARAIRTYVESVEHEPAGLVQLDNFWVVSQFAGTPSPVHFHSGDLSGVLYLKVPSISADEEQRNYIAGRQAGYINFLIGGKQRFARSLISFKPVIGDLYIFPGWLLHGAEPFRGTGERRSLAFNARVD
jgi:hypothetical protein